MGHNPPRLERQIAFWGWWADPGFALAVHYGHRTGDLIMPPGIREIGRALIARGYGPEGAVWLLLEGMDLVGMRTRPGDWYGMRTWEEWLARFPDPALGAKRMRPRS